MVKKILKISIASVLAAVLISILCTLAVNTKQYLDDKAAAAAAAELYSEDNVRKNYSVVFENNRRKLDEIMEYGDEFCSGYVSTKRDIKLHKEILSELRALSDEICVGAETDIEKVKKIEYWVADNLYYNHDAAETSVTAEVISLENVLETKTATCAGYSNLFSALCNMQDIYCVNLRGGTYVKGYSPDNLLSVPMNHEWNAVRIDGEWLFIDTTWLSNNRYRGGEYIRSETMDTEYTDMDFEFMSYEHRIDLADYRDFASSINYFEQEN